MSVFLQDYQARLFGMGGVAPKFKYDVGIFMPRFMFGAFVTEALPTVVSNEGLQKIGLNCIEATMPGRQLATTEYRYNGPMKKQPYGVIYDELQLSFLCGADYAEKKFFDFWITGIYDDKYNLYYHDDIVSDIVISQNDLHGNPIYTVKAFDCYPTSVQPMQLDAVATDFQRLDVRFFYRDFEVIEKELRV